MKKLVLCALSVLSVSAHAVLDKIDADGVTEKGGSSAYARMIPRTGASGLIDTSLLPPVADWASRPIPGLYYVSAGSASGGNGSPQYPFNNIVTAIDSADTGSAVLIVPGTYSGVCSLGEGKSVTLCGFGSSTYIKSLSITVRGTASVSLCGVRVGRLSLSGGTAFVRLSSASVEELSGSSPVTVSRADMGSIVMSSTKTYSDSYTGNNTAEMAKSLKGDAGVNASVSGQRILVGSESVAFMSDVSGATNGLLVSTIQDLRHTDSVLSNSITTECSARVRSVESLSNSVYSSLVTMDAKIAEIGDSWNSRLDTLSANIGKIGSATTDMYVKETNDVRKIYAELDAVRKEAKSDDSELASTLRGETAMAVSGLRDAVPGIADERAAIKIEGERQGIISSAVSLSMTNTYELIIPVNARLKSISEDVSVLSATSKTHTASIRSLVSEDKKIIGLIAASNSKETNDIALVRGEIGDVRSDYAYADAGVKSELRGEMRGISNSIYSISYNRALTAIQNSRNGIINDAYVKSVQATTDLIAPVTEKVSALDSRITQMRSELSTLSTTVDDVRGDLDDLSSKHNTLSGKVETYNTNTTKELASIKRWQDDINEWRSDAEDMDNICKEKINGILAILRELKKGTPWSSITIPSDIP